MVSNAREDLPEPLTPVTTVMALCGISTLIFLRLWTRAPRTRIDSCSGRTSVVAWVISLVAKSKPRQRVSSALPKLQIILPLSKRGKRGVVGTTSRLLGEGDLADATLHFQVNRRGGFAIGIVDIGVSIVLQTAHVDGADAAGSVSNDTDIFRKADVGLSNAAFNIGGQIGLAVTGGVDIHLGRSHIGVQAGLWDVEPVQDSLSLLHSHIFLYMDVLS